MHGYTAVIDFRWLRNCLAGRMDLGYTMFVFKYISFMLISGKYIFY